MAAENAAKAHANIRRKAEFFNTLLEKALRDRELHGAAGCIKLPDSVRQFNLWAPVDDKGEQLKKNSSQTLNKAPGDLLKRVQSLVEGMLKLKFGEERSPKHERLVALRARLALSENLRRIAEKELILSLDLQSELSQEVIRQKAEILSTASKAKELIANLEAQLSAEREQRAKLTVALAKTTRIR